MQKSLSSESRSFVLPCFSRLVKEKAFWLSCLCRHGTTWKISMGGSSTVCRVVRNGVLCFSAPQHPKFTGKPKEMPLVPSSPTTFLPQQICFQSTCGAAVKGCVASSIPSTPLLQPSHIWICKRGPEDTMRRRPSSRVRTAGSW